MTRRVLLVSYYFPPLGLGGITRPLHLFKLLPSFGYECDVLTVKPVLYHAYEPELLMDLDRNRIHRSGSRDPQRLLYLCGVRKMSRRVHAGAESARERFFPDSKIGWVGPATRLGKRIIRSRKIDLIISTSPPISAHLIGMRLSQETGIPWVADFRDFWGSYPVEQSFERPESVDKGKTLLKQIVGAVKAVITVNRSIADYLGCGEVITNGFDSELAKRWRTPAAGSEFTIGLLGTFNDDLPVEPLFRVLAELRSRSPHDFERLRLKQVGRVDQVWLESLLKKYELTGICTSHGLQPRDRTVYLLSEASMFYIGLNPGKETDILPGRMFDMLASGRPVLAYVPTESEIGRLIEQSHNGFCFGDATIQSAADYLQNCLMRASMQTLTVEPLPPYATPYSWDTLVEKYARLLDRIV